MNFLFGSYAYGNPSAGSDLDIAVVTENGDSSVEKAAELWEALKDIPLSKDIVVVSREEYEFYKKEPGSIFRTIAEKLLKSILSVNQIHFEKIHDLDIEALIRTGSKCIVGI